VVPSSGPIYGNQYITIVGNDLNSGNDVASVTFCGSPVARIVSQGATRLVIVTAAVDTSMTCTVSITSTSFGVSTLSDAYQYDAQWDMSCPGFGGSITSIKPASGPLVGGNLVTITGKSLGKGDDISRVTIGGVQAAQIRQNVTFVVVVIPAAAASNAADILVKSGCFGTTVTKAGYFYNLGTRPLSACWFVV
jgi:hypothetical protein